MYEEALSVKGLPLDVAWLAAIATFTQYLQAAGRCAGTIRLRTYYLTRFGRLVPVGPFAVTMDQLIVWLSNPDWGAESRKSARASLCSFYRWAVDSDRIEERRNPARRLPAINVPRALPRPVPDMVLRNALFGATDRDRLMLMLAGYDGLRRGEISRVHLGRDLDWPLHELIVRGKGGTERRLPLHPDLEHELRAEIERRVAGEHGTGWRYDSQISPASYLFPGKHGHIQPDTVGRILDKLLAGRWTAHTLRHRFATVAYGADRDLRAVQELLGHSKPETTARYVQEPPEARRAAVLAVGLREAS
jgi:integrase